MTTAPLKQMPDLLRRGNPKLKMVSYKVQKDERIGATLWFMKEQLRRRSALGIAAIQLGIPQRIILLNVAGFQQVVVNPVIEKRYGGRANSSEGCLSYPGLVKKVRRYKRVIVTGENQDRKPIRLKMKGLAAYVVQHEVDHLNGITIG